MSQNIFPIALEKLIPQRAPFILVDGIVSHESGITIAQFIINEDHVLIEDGYLSAYGLLENMAQAAALMSGYEAHLEKTIPKTGFIGTITNANIYHLPAPGDVMLTEVIQTTRIMNIIVIECMCHCGDTKLADCSMKIVLMEDL